MEIVVRQEVIEGKIYMLRGHKVMLDKDLAVLYGVKPIRLREQVKRNLLSGGFHVSAERSGN